MLWRKMSSRMNLRASGAGCSGAWAANMQSSLTSPETRGSTSLNWPQLASTKRPAITLHFSLDLSLPPPPPAPTPSLFGQRSPTPSPNPTHISNHLGRPVLREGLIQHPPRTLFHGGRVCAKHPHPLA